MKVLTDLLDAADEMLAAGASDCDNTPAGHETFCECPPHLRARAAAAALRAAVEAVRHA